MTCPATPGVEIMMLALALFLAMAVAVAFMARQLVKLTTAEGQLSMEKVTDRKYRLLKWLKAESAQSTEDSDAIFISMRDKPLFEELSQEGLFVVIGGRWNGLKVNVANLDTEKGEPCTRVERKDYSGYRDAIPWLGRNGDLLMHAPIH